MMLILYQYLYCIIPMVAYNGLL